MKLNEFYDIVKHKDLSIALDKLCRTELMKAKCLDLCKLLEEENDEFIPDDCYIQIRGINNNLVPYIIFKDSDLQIELDDCPLLVSYNMDVFICPSASDLITDFSDIFASVLYALAGKGRDLSTQVTNILMRSKDQSKYFNGITLMILPDVDLVLVEDLLVEEYEITLEDEEDNGEV